MISAISFAEDCSLLNQYPDELEICEEYQALKLQYENRGRNIENVSFYKALRILTPEMYRESPTPWKAKIPPVPATWLSWEKGNAFIDQTIERIKQQQEIIDLKFFQTLHQELIDWSIIGVQTLLPVSGGISSPGVLRATSWYYSLDYYLGNSEVKRYWWRPGFKLDTLPSESIAAFKELELLGDPVRNTSVLGSFWSEDNGWRHNSFAINWKENVDGSYQIFYMHPAWVEKEFEAFREKLKKQIKLFSSGEKAEGTPIAVAADLQRRYVAIHPFHEGQGRMSRFVQDLILKPLGLPYVKGGTLQNDLTTPGEEYRAQTREDLRNTVLLLRHCLDRTEGYCSDLYDSLEPDVAEIKSQVDSAIKSMETRLRKRFPAPSQPLLAEIPLKAKRLKASKAFLKTKNSFKFGKRGSENTLDSVLTQIWIYTVLNGTPLDRKTALSNLGVPNGEVLYDLTLIQGSSDPQTSELATVVLGGVYGCATERRLEEISKSDSTLIASLALGASASLNDKIKEGVLGRLLEAPDMDERRQAAKAIFSACPTGPYLDHLLMDSIRKVDQHVVGSALKGIKRSLGDPFHFYQQLYYTTYRDWRFKLSLMNEARLFLDTYDRPENPSRLFHLAYDSGDRWDPMPFMCNFKSLNPGAAFLKMQKYSHEELIHPEKRHESLAKALWTCRKDRLEITKYFLSEYSKKEKASKGYFYSKMDAIENFLDGRHVSRATRPAYEDGMVELYLASDEKNRRTLVRFLSSSWTWSSREKIFARLLDYEDQEVFGPVLIGLRKMTGLGPIAKRLWKRGTPRASAILMDLTQIEKLESPESSFEVYREIFKSDPVTHEQSHVQNSARFHLRLDFSEIYPKIRESRQDEFLQFLLKDPYFQNGNNAKELRQILHNTLTSIKTQKFKMSFESKIQGLL